MKLATSVAMSLLLLCPLGLTAQGRRRSVYGMPGDVTPGAVTGVTINIDGVLKGLSKKEILIATDDEHTTSLRRTSKTKFLRGNKEVKADDAALEGNVSVEAAEDKDSKLMAVVVHLCAKPCPEASFHTRQDPKSN